MGTKDKPPENLKKTRSRGSDRRGLRSLAAEVPRITRSVLGRKGFAEAGLLQHWPEIAGPDLARITQPVKLSFPRADRTGGTLTVRCGGAAALEVQHLAPVILQRINAHLGYGALNRLKIEQGKLGTARRKTFFLPAVTSDDTNEIEGRLTNVSNEELRERLKRLGLSIRRRSKIKT